MIQIFCVRIVPPIHFKLRKSCSYVVRIINYSTANSSLEVARRETRADTVWIRLLVENLLVYVGRIHIRAIKCLVA